MLQSLLYYLPYCLVFIGFLIFCAFIGLFIVSWLTPWPSVSLEQLTQKYALYEPTGKGKSEDFPCTISQKDSAKATEPTRYLSVVVPAMNEQERLPAMLDDCLPYLEKRAKDDPQFTYEVIIVDDGSRDGTADVGFNYSLRYSADKVRVLKLPKNVGKGGAVRCGTLRSRGELVVFADADGATTFADVYKLEKELKSESGGVIDWTCPMVAVGSRSHLEKDSIAERSFFRTILMLGFHVLVRVFTVRTVQDTQCGFKMFTRSAAVKLFTNLHIERWAFDVELLFIAEKLHIPIFEVAVRWQEIDGSKITPIWSWLQMGRDLVLIWFRYLVGIWKIGRLA
uniref:Dolichyl-phosphate beta-glucosyltransferase n=1 Tax=Plectus sambesii TaxID=2011161 RepID=A0A914XGV7_9BILA